MSIVIVGGNDRMVCQYQKVCQGYGCKAKVYTQMSARLKDLGCPDLMILFTNTVSHKMVHCTLSEAKRSGVTVMRAHTSSIAALRNILEQACPG